MSRQVRLLVALAALCMASAYVLPLWRIGLIAPQYPEGLGMKIRINTVTGVKEMDLQSINGLNHYIGMKRIEPDEFPELRFMPMLLGLAIAGAVLAAATASRRVLAGWALGYWALCGAGLVDFWRWEYRYGHDLDTVNAIMKIEGMTYQPPLIGTKQLLNFTATSWPDWGGIGLIVAAVLAGVSLWLAFRRPALGIGVSSLSAVGHD